MRRWSMYVHLVDERINRKFGGGWCKELEMETPMSSSVTGDRYLRDAECRPSIVQGCQTGIFPDNLQQPLPIFD